MANKAWIWLVMALLPHAIGARDVTLYREYFPKGGDPVDHIVNAEELRKIPLWEPLSRGRKPPLERNRALELAKQAATAAGYNDAGNSRISVSLQTVNRFEKDLLKALPADACRWFYLVEFRNERRPAFRCVVTMSGAVARRGRN